MKYKLNTYVVVDKDNNIIMTGSGIDCRRIANNYNIANYCNKPYAYKYINVEFNY